ncbi:MAG TPA: glycosyltransferase family 2 protein [Verrucomicrobiae bacterium]|nr:glycosyltransferase family 2 protein [Verrucomicrobiae bacterium]
MNDGCQRICLTPTRNEAWIIRPFLAAARCWANHIVVADQGSTDGTLEQLRATPGVDVVINDLPSFDEIHRQRLLLRRARQIEGKRILIALDADEVLSANCAASSEWGRISEAPAGTILRFRWVNILPGFQRAWIPHERLPCGFVDDGSEHPGINRIHNPRLPCPADAPVMDLDDIVVLHFQYVIWERMRSKQRWYQVWEHLNYPQKRPLDIFRQYNHMHGSWEKTEIHPVQPPWLEGYDRAGIDFRSLACEPVTWWDRAVVGFLCKHGPNHFRRLAIWDRAWNPIVEQLGIHGRDLADPRSFFEKSIHRFLTATQMHRSNWGVRGVERFLRALGW